MVPHKWISSGSSGRDLNVTLCRLFALFLLYSELPLYGVTRATWKRRRGAKVKCARTIYKEIAVLTICNICYFLTLPLPMLRKSKWRCSACCAFIFCIAFWVEVNANKAYKFLRDGCCIYPILYLTNVAPPCDLCPPLCCEILAMRMIQTRILENSVDHPNSQISMRITSLEFVSQVCRNKGLWSSMHT